MKAEKKIDLHIPNIIGFEKVAMGCVVSVAKMMGFADDRIEDLKTAVSEACINAIEHGNEMDSSMKVGITLTIEDSLLQVAVEDKGKGISQFDAPRIEKKIEGKDKPRGWGIFLINKLMDEVKFESRPEGGNVVRMIIHLKR
jgi:serine/threonine-protein kinase RsbW